MYVAARREQGIAYVYLRDGSSLAIPSMTSQCWIGPTRPRRLTRELHLSVQSPNQLATPITGSQSTARVRLRKTIDHSLADIFCDSKRQADYSLSW